jgi:hypothetical protein
MIGSLRMFDNLVELADANNADVGAALELLHVSAKGVQSR